jgi:hypothetical protein
MGRLFSSNSKLDPFSASHWEEITENEIFLPFSYESEKNFKLGIDGFFPLYVL